MRNVHCSFSLLTCDIKPVTDVSDVSYDGVVLVAALNLNLKDAQFPAVLQKAVEQYKQVTPIIKQYKQ